MQTISNWSRSALKFYLEPRIDKRKLYRVLETITRLDFPLSLKRIQLRMEKKALDIFLFSNKLEFILIDNLFRQRPIKDCSLFYD